MIDLQTGIENNPLNLIHPVIYTDECLGYAKQAIRTHKQENTNKMPMKQLSKEHIQTISEHKWLKNCDTVLLNPADYQDEQAMIDSIISTLESEAALIQEEVLLTESKPIIALDLETIGLNKTVKKVAGKNVTYNSIVSICLATSDSKGYYIPVNHNQKDNIPNLSLVSAVKLLQHLVDNFHIVYHNAVFDQEVMALSGVMLKHSSHTDTMLLAILGGYRIEYRQVGLKFLSAELLNRNMLEINEIVGTKDYIQMQTIPASNAYVYGCSDAMNTLALFYYFIESDNPYVSQKTTTKLLHKSIGTTRSMFRLGIPVKYDEALATLKTIVRRLVMLEILFYRTVTDEEVSIGSAEQIGTHFYILIKKQYEKHYNEGKNITIKDKGFQVLCKRLEHDFEMVVKAKELKSGTKVVAPSPESVIVNLYNGLEEWEFIDEEVYDEIITICEILMEYRSLLQRVAIFYKLTRFAYNDDLNICRSGIALKLCGADTLRYSNQSSRNGAFDSLTIHELRTKTNSIYNIGDGICGINAQGIPSDTGTKKTLKQVTNFKDLIDYKRWKRLDNKVEERIQQMFKLHKYVSNE